MFYKALGYLVWNGGKRYVARRYGSQVKLAGGGAALMGIALGILLALLFAKRS